MKYAIFCCVLATLCCEIRGQIFGGSKPPEVTSLAGVETKWFSQKLDHSNKADTRMWNQRYLINTAPWKNQANSPVFLVVGGESAIWDGWMTGGAWVPWAYNHSALIFQLEHRFYGQSRPTSDASVDNMKYLTSRQVMGDIEYFITQMNAQYKFTSKNKWILFGGSYAGNLVAWARLKLPNLVYGAVSSSGPLQAKVDFFEYADVVRTSLDTISSGCSSQITSAFKSLQQLFKSNQGIQTVRNKFNFCSGFNTNKPKDIITFYQSLFQVIARAAQYNNGNGKGSLADVCRYMQNPKVPDPVDRLAQLKNASSSGCIYASYEGWVNYYKPTSWDSGPVSGGSRQWIFQTCNEFGYYQTSEKSNSLLSDTIPLDLFPQQCIDIYGSIFNPKQLNQAVDSTNQYYQGMDIKVDRVVYVQGSIDPWHALGMVKNPTAQSPLIYIQGTSHCQDMYLPSSNDLPTLKAAKEQIKANVDKWLT